MALGHVCWNGEVTRTILWVKNSTLAYAYIRRGECEYVFCALKIVIKLPCRTLKKESFGGPVYQPCEPPAETWAV